jgi:putative ABC transport system permease protein
MLTGSFVGTIRTRLQSSFRTNITGDFIVHAKSEVGLSLFGVNLPALGEYFEIPALGEQDKLLEEINSLEGTAKTVNQISGAALMKIFRKQYPVPFFGIDFSRHFDFFPSMRIVEGSIPSSGEKSAMISEVFAEKVVRATGKTPKPGSKLQLNTLGPDGFRIRELPIAAIYAYSGHGPVMDEIILIDPVTARELNSILVSQFATDLTREETDLLDMDADLLFGGTDDDTESQDSDSSSVFSLLDSLNSVSDETSSAESREAADGSWQFIIIKTKSGTDNSAYLQELKKKLAGYDVKILDWRKAAGSSTEYAWILQMLFIVSMIIIFITGASGITNLMVTAYFSRMSEIGTIRAIGGQKSVVARLFLYEYSILSLAGGVCGLILATVITLVLNSLGIAIHNPILQMMLGSKIFGYSISAGMTLLTLGLAVLTGIFSSIVPLIRAIAMRPVQAIQGGIS